MQRLFFTITVVSLLSVLSFAYSNRYTGKRIMLVRAENDYGQVHKSVEISRAMNPVTLIIRTTVPAGLRPRQAARAIPYDIDVLGEKIVFHERRIVHSYNQSRRITMAVGPFRVEKIDMYDVMVNAPGPAENLSLELRRNAYLLPDWLIWPALLGVIIGIRGMWRNRVRP